MPVQHQTAIDIVVNECSKVDERYVGHKEELCKVVCRILEHERDHRINATDIQKKISRELATAARTLVGQNRKLLTSRGDSS